MHTHDTDVAGVNLMARASRLRVAIVHEWLTNWAGSERCVEALWRAFPNNRTYTSVVDEAKFADRARDLRTSPLQHLPYLRTRHAHALPLLPLAMSRVRISDPTDLVIRSFHSFATLPRQPSDVPEIVYCHTPPRFVYARTALSGESRRIRAAAWVAGAAMARSDKERVRRATAVVANSRHTASRIAAIYGVAAQVIHPPVNLDRFTPLTAEPRDDYFMMGGRLVAYKRPDVAIEAFRQLPNERLVVVGDGRHRRSLAGAPSNVTFVGAVDDRRYDVLLSRAKGFVLPGEEDFGIAAVEALAAGVPVVALGRGGALDYVQDGVNGLLVPSSTPAALRSTVQEMAATRWEAAPVSATAQPFGEQVFIRRMQEVAMAVIAG